jgi:hypothetical protein
MNDELAKSFHEWLREGHLAGTAYAGEWVIKQLKLVDLFLLLDEKRISIDERVRVTIPLEKFLYDADFDSVDVVFAIRGSIEFPIDAKFQVPISNKENKDYGRFAMRYKQLEWEVPQLTGAPRRLLKKIGIKNPRIQELRRTGQGVSKIAAVVDSEEDYIAAKLAL